MNTMLSRYAFPEIKSLQKIFLLSTNACCFPLFELKHIYTHMREKDRNIYFNDEKALHHGTIKRLVLFIFIAGLCFCYQVTNKRPANTEYLIGN